MPQLTPEELMAIAMACRPAARKEEERAKGLENPTVRAPILAAAAQYAALADRFERARKLRTK
jgi:hypothetical protein